MTLPMDTCVDTLHTGTGGRDTAFPSTCGRGLRGTSSRAVGGQDVPLVRPSFCIVKEGTLSSRS